jgi:molybdopterin-binding protein
LIPRDSASNVPIVPQMRISEAAALLGVSDDTIRRWAEAGRLRTIRDDAGRQVVEGADLARLAQELADAPALQRERELSGRGSRESARNRLQGIVTRVTKDTVMAQIDLQCGPYRVVSLMSREAADDLGLEPGVVAVASVKSTQVVVEVPA